MWIPRLFDSTSFDNDTIRETDCDERKRNTEWETSKSFWNRRKNLKTPTSATHHTVESPKDTQALPQRLERKSERTWNGTTRNFNECRDERVKIVLNLQRYMHCVWAYWKWKYMLRVPTTLVISTSSTSYDIHKSAARDARDKAPVPTTGCWLWLWGKQS